MGTAVKTIFVVILFHCNYVCIAQHNFPDTITAFKINDKIIFDGKLSESFWQNNSNITNFTQRELEYGKPSSEQTKVSIVYDNLAMYIGVWCYQKANTIHAKFMQRDFSYDQDDNFQLALSPFNDKRNG